MKALAISYSGMEDITALEIKEILGVEVEERKSCCVFECSEEKLAKYTYLGQGVNRVLILLDAFKIKDVSDLSRIQNIDFSKWLDGRTFAARAEIINNEFDEVEKTIGDNIEGKVDLKNPDVVVFAYIYSNQCYMGIDFSGDLSKRDYKIFSARGDLKGTIAYALVRLSGYDSSKSFLNLNAKAGTIAIEAALFGSGLSVHHFNKDKFYFLKFLDIDLSKFDSKQKESKVYASDSEGYLELVRKNAKIAGVNISFEKVDKVGRSQQGSSTTRTTDCVVKFFRSQAEVSGLKEKREIKHGKEVLGVFPL